MMQFEQFLPLAQVAGAIVTALATIALFCVTWILARHTKKLSEATSEPMVAVTLEPSDWALIYVNQVIQNTGNATAFDIEISFLPDLETKRTCENPRSKPIKIDIIRPGQIYQDFVGEAKELFEKEFDVIVSWRRKPGVGRRTSLNYRLSIDGYRHQTQLGPASPLHQIATEVKHLRDDWKAAARGNQRLEINSHDADDRKLEETERAERMKELREISEQRKKD